MKKILILLLLGITSQFVRGQAGAKAYTGLTLSYTKDPVTTPSGHMHSGFVIGIDGRLNDSRMYFLIGGLYGQTDLLATKEPSFFGGDKLTYFKGRIGLGFDLIRLSPSIYLTGKLLGSAQFVQNYDLDLLTIPGYTIINDGIAGFVTGIGVRIGIVSIDFEYEYGLFNLYNERKETTVDYLTLSAGVNF